MLGTLTDICRLWKWERMDEEGACE